LERLTILPCIVAGDGIASARKPKPNH